MRKARRGARASRWWLNASLRITFHFPAIRGSSSCIRARTLWRPADGASSRTQGDASPLRRLRWNAPRVIVRPTATHSTIPPRVRWLVRPRH